MKRFHVHIHVDDLAQSIAFYSRLFAAEPARVEADYAKWMLDDPRVNFAISTRGDTPGLDHLGFQVDDAAELAQLKARAESADMALLDEGATSCCYARSEKALDHRSPRHCLGAFPHAGQYSGVQRAGQNPRSRCMLCARRRTRGRAGPRQGRSGVLRSGPVLKRL